MKAALAGPPSKNTSAYSEWLLVEKTKSRERRSSFVILTVPFIEGDMQQATLCMFEQTV